MRSLKHGKNISSTSVENITPFGIWLLIENEEYFLGYKDYPMFLDKPIRQILNVEQHFSHLYWPDMDIDLELESIKTPEKYPLIAA